MVTRVAGFDWDAGNLEKCAGHGVSIEEIESVLQGEVWTFPDVAHSRRETRYLAIGRTAAGRHVFLAFTLRKRGDEQWLRPISARYMHAKEIQHYQAEIAHRQI
ncbi:MAG: BrnT family toxin [Steroidobacteraceae bacterium]